jgi:hypothetical protein
VILGLQCLFTPIEVIVSKMDDELMVFKGFRYNNLYLVDFTSEDADLRTCLFTKASLGWLWHRRLAHVGMSTLKRVLKKDMVRGLKDVVFCRRFETGGSLSRRVKYRRVPQPRWVGARPSAKGGSEGAGDGRERGGNPAAFVFVPRLGRVRLQ